MCLSPDEAGHPDYFVDLIEQLAERARDLGEIEVALHLEATAMARRLTLEREGAERILDPVTL